MNHGILFPVMALVAWTMTVLLLMPYRRLGATFRGQVTSDDFKFGESVNVPSDVRIPNRNFMNLLEVPVLFYVVCITLYVTDQVDVSVIRLAWGYVGLRVLHSLVHLTYNNVLHRLSLYAASNVVLIIIWSVTLIRMVQ